MRTSHDDNRKVSHTDDDDVKAVLRARIRARRRTWSESATPEAQTDRAQRISVALMAVTEVAGACHDGRVITCFASLPTEPPTAALLQRLHAAGATVLLPVIRPDRVLHWAPYFDAAALSPAVLGILEPTADSVVATSPAELLALDPAVLIIPALAVDSTGARLGQGGGYYDAVLADLPSHGGPTVLALVGEDEVLASGVIPMGSHDRHVDRFITG